MQALRHGISRARLSAVAMGDISRAASGAPRILRPRVDGTVFLVCDVQERFRDLIYEFGSVVQVASTLARVGDALRCVASAPAL